MTWLRLEDTFPEHPSIAGLSDGAYRLYVNALCYSGRNLTDGFIPRAVAPLLYPKATAKRAAELVEVGRWEVVDGGWQIHNYLERQRSRAQVESEKKKAAERQKKRRESQQSHGVTSDEVRVPESQSHPPDTLGQSVSPDLVGAVDNGRTDDIRIGQALRIVAKARFEANYPGGKGARNPTKVMQAILTEKQTELGPEAQRLVDTYPDISASLLADVLQGNTNGLGYLTRSEAS